MQLGAFYDTIFGSMDFCRIMVYDEEKCIVWEELVKCKHYQILFFVTMKIILQCCH
nr:MAG TPA: hypothetical protein [Caudoviricetes sp.]